MNRDEQIKALSEAMSSVPGMRQAERAGLGPMVRTMWATDLIDRWGVSIDPDKAKVTAVHGGGLGMGNHGPWGIEEKTRAARRDPEPNATPEQARMVLGPVMAQMLDTTQPELAARINAAKTPEQRQAMLEELRAKIPAPIMEAALRYAASDPDDLKDHAL